MSLHVPIAFATAELASGGVVHAAADKHSFLLPEFVIADAIILRPVRPLKMDDETNGWSSDWPTGMEDKRAMTSWMALDDVIVENGCM